MTISPGILLMFPCLALLALVFLPASFANSNVRRLIQLVNGIAYLHAFAAVAALIVSLKSGPVHTIMLPVFPQLPVSGSLFFDGVSSLMLMLVASIGWVICRFSVRYLDGEAGQGNYFRWTGFTIGAVSLFIIAGNLAVMVFALLLTSIGLHQLLVHYSDRPAARHAAAIKFIFSRLGDLCLIAAAFLLYGEFETLELHQLFTAAGLLTPSEVAGNAALTATGWLLVLCAVLKSAQFPFHTWLPETMEAPTPVSALMHAGIVNSGGYLLIRMAPIVSLAPAAMTAVACLGAFTAVMAALVMLSQTSIKRSLAWSTIAQMGFMMLQCGLGAYSAAMLHILAHSLYKAHAFLSSGSVMSERAAMNTVAAKPRTRAVSGLLFSLSALMSVTLFISLTAATGISLQSKPGGYLLGFVLCLGLTRWMWQMLKNGRRLMLSGIGMTAVLICAYLGSFLAVDTVLAESSVGVQPVASDLLMLTIASVFVAILVVESLFRQGIRASWLQRLYVHSSNGFYCDTFWRRVSRTFSS